MKNLDFHSLLTRKIIIVPILTTSLIHYLKGWGGNVRFELGSERVKQLCKFKQLCVGDFAQIPAIDCFHNTVQVKVSSSSPLPILYRSYKELQKGWDEVTVYH